MTLTDESLMPFGQYEGKLQMKEVPTSYLKFLMTNVYKGNKPRGALGSAVHGYICRNYDRIMKNQYKPTS